MIASMCGIVGVACAGGNRLSVLREHVEAMRDRMSHRGPDAAGLWISPSVMLGHRRLAVRDLSDAGHQPIVSSDGRQVLVYNGELYNDAELRASLAQRGVHCASGCDAETLLLTLATFGMESVRRLRGMFAFAWFDRSEQRLILARDPLGIKPLYFWKGIAGGQTEFAFASEIPALLSHPSIACRPDLVTVRGYLATIRTTLGSRTMFEGISTLRPGEVMTLDLRGDRPRATVADLWDEAMGGDARETREVVDESIRLHVVSDVPVCSLLSGGLDSSIVASGASALVGGLRTYAAGWRSGDAADDLAMAQRVAEHLGLKHDEVIVDERSFAEGWCLLAQRLGVPLSTPNEVAIWMLSRRLRSDGHVVALSGEGADELFAGYDHALRQGMQFEAADMTDRAQARHELELNAWVPSTVAGQVLSGAQWLQDAEEGVLEQVERDFAWCRAREVESGRIDSRLGVHLRYQQRVNLAGLLQRLDSSMMLESVEGRTPLADAVVAGHANAMRPEDRIRWVEGRAETKRPLRAAYAGVLPREVIERPKASFPLPFQEWMGTVSRVVRRSGLVRELFSEAAIEVIAGQPGGVWRLAWPMVNLALWDCAVFGGLGAAERKDNARAEARAL